MAIDLNALKRASEGNPETRVTVRKVWLKEIHQLLTARDARISELEKELAAAKTVENAQEKLFKEKLKQQGIKVDLAKEYTRPNPKNFGEFYE